MNDKADKTTEQASTGKVQVDGIVIREELVCMADKLAEDSEMCSRMEEALIKLAKANGLYRAANVLERHIAG